MLVFVCLFVQQKSKNDTFLVNFLLPACLVWNQVQLLFAETSSEGQYNLCRNTLISPLQQHPVNVHLNTRLHLFCKTAES